MKITKGYLEVFLVDHCNLRCAHCSHFSPYMKPWSHPLEDFRKDMQALSRVMQVGRLRFLGGEPLLNRELPAFIDLVKEMKVAKQIGLCTNGLLLHKTAEETLAKLDWLDVSLYPGTKPSPEQITETAESLSHRLGLRLNIFPKPDFRHQILDAPIDDPTVVQEIYRTCKMAHGGWDMFHDGCHTVYQGRYYKCNRPAYTASYLQGTSQDTTDLPNFKELDGVDLHLPNLKDRLVRYLGSETALHACQWCLGTCGVRAPHRLMDRQEVLEGSQRSLSWREALDHQAMESDRELLKPIKARTKKQLGRLGS